MTPPSCAPSSRWAAALAWKWWPRAWKPRASSNSCARRVATSRRDACSASPAPPRNWARCCRARPAPAARRSRASRRKRARSAMAAPETPQPRPAVLTRSRPQRPWRRVASAVLALVVAVGAWHVVKPLPPGVHVRGEYVGMPDASVRFLADVTAQDGAGGRIQRRAIHEATLELVRGARGFLVLDYFLFNGQGGPKGPLLLR